MSSPSQTPLSQSHSLSHTHWLTQEVVVWLSSMAQVSENRSKLHDALMHDDIMRERDTLLRRGECRMMRDVGKAQRDRKGDLKDGVRGWKFTLTLVFPCVHKYLPTF